ncbi:MAG TPA: hypothetical protein VMH81_34785 [Bryobacteraceae bacterium]|nr:hypothetical protein [Bryobacteraceae bacterium]
MPVQPTIIAFLVLLGGIAAWRLTGAWWKYRGRRVITCPENRRPAGVLVDSRHAAATSLGGTPELRLSSCSRWPERAGCGQECLAQIAAAPEDCLVRNILAKWYAGKVCASCGLAFGDIEWSGRKPALLRPGKISVEWNEVSADKVYEVLAASQPLCFACHMANVLVRERPELAVDRPAGHL